MILKSFSKILNYFTNIGKNEIYLGRWNYRNTEKYMEWANYDNCYTNLNLKK